MSSDFDKQWNSYTRDEQEQILDLFYLASTKFNNNDAVWEDLILKLSHIIFDRRLRGVNWQESKP